MLCRFALYFPVHAAKPIGKKLTKVPACTIRAEKTKVVNMRVSAFVYFADIDWIDFIQPILLRERLADIVVESVDAALHVCVFLHAPVAVVKIVAKHIDRSTDERVDFTRSAPFFAIENIGLRRLCVTCLDENFLNDILNAFDIGRVIAVALLSKANNLVCQPFGALLICAVNGLCGLPNRILYLETVKRFQMPVALFDHFKHVPYPSHLMCNISLACAIFCVNRRSCIPNIDIFSGQDVDNYEKKEANDQKDVKSAYIYGSCKSDIATTTAYSLHNVYKHVECFERFHKLSEN